MLPSDPFNDALTQYRNGNWSAAEAACRQALQAAPDHGGVWFLLGAVHQAQGQTGDAIASYQQAVRLRPDFAEAHNNLGTLLEERGQRDDAVAHYRQALRLKADYPAARSNLIAALLSLGLACEQRGQLEQAANHYQEVLRHNPANAEALSNLGNVHRKQGDAAAAVGCYRQALAADPGFAQAHNNLGVMLAGQGQPDQALAHLAEAVRLKPDHAEALSNLAGSYKDQGRVEEALDCYRRAIAAQPNNAALHSNLLLALHFHPGIDPDTVFAEHLRWAKQHAAPLAPPPHPCPSPPRGEGRKLRIGYVSADFRQHVMGFFMEGVLPCHDHEHFEIVCYSDVARPDDLTRRLQSFADRWHCIAGKADAEVAERIRQDGIHVLVDLAGHTAGNRLLVFARKPAPIQVTHFGYMHTSGLATIDYRLTDACCDPPGMTERFHTEKLLRLPDIAWCYRPPAECPRVGELPALRNGSITFGSLNSLAKASAEVVAVWSRILEAVPGSRMLILAGAGQGGDQRLTGLFARHGIGPQRLTLVGRRSRSDYFELYGSVDIALDAFPFSGCNTTMDALWVGVPVLTRAGRNAIGRQGVTILRSVGLPEWIAESDSEYVASAVRLASDLAGLARLRKTLRHRMAESPLTGTANFTRNLEAAYQRMWTELEGRKGVSVNRFR